MRQVRLQHAAHELRCRVTTPWLALLAAVLAVSCAAQAGEVQVAVAANFSTPMRKIASLFQADTGHTALLSFGSTGTSYTQIKNGAPFDVLLAADDKTPARLEREGQGKDRYTYAIGRLVLWSSHPKLVDHQGGVLKGGRIGRLTVAGPRLAPYGTAAVEVLGKLGLLGALRPKFVQGENIGQTYQFVATGNAPLGFVAMSQVFADGKLREGSAWVVPASLHSPIRQDLVLLVRSRDNPAATALLRYQRSDKARTVIRSYGYES